MGSHQEAVSQGYRSLASALGQFNDALQYQSSNAGAFNERLGNVTNHLSSAYRTHGLPHSASKLAKRVGQLREASPQRALAYLYTQLPNPNQFQFEARGFHSWSGFIEGLAERTKIAEIPKSALRSATESVDELRIKVEHLIAEKQGELDQLHRTYHDLTLSMATKELHRTETWDRFIEDAGKRHEDAMANHEQRMNNIESVFHEKMALRGPVEYWSKRQDHHKDFAVGIGILSFILILAGGGGGTRPLGVARVRCDPRQRQPKGMASSLARHCCSVPDMGDSSGDPAFPQPFAFADGCGGTGGHDADLSRASRGEQVGRVQGPQPDPGCPVPSSLGRHGQGRKYPSSYARSADPAWRQGLNRFAHPRERSGATSQI